MTTPSTLRQFRAMIAKFAEFARWRALLLVLLLVVTALSEGLGLLMVLPLLSLTDTGGSSDDPAGVAHAIRDAGQDLGLSMSLEVVLGIFVALVALRQLLAYFGARLTADTRIGFVAAVRKEQFNALGSTSWRFLHGRHLDRVGQVLLVDSWRIGEAALHAIRILSGLVLLLANLAVAMLVSPVLAIAVLGGITALALLFSNRLNRVQRQGREISEIQNRVYRVVENFLSNLRTAKMAGAVPSMQSDFGAAIDRLNGRIAAFVRDAELVRMSLVTAGAGGIAIALLVAVNVLDVRGPELLLLVLITARFVPRVSSLNQDLHRLVHDLPAFEHASQVLQQSLAHPDAVSGDSKITRPGRSIALQDVVVTFANDGAVPVLDRVSIELTVGEMLALTGRSGAGKSTLADVLAGLLLPDSGGILVDGRRLQTGSLPGWRRQVGYVSQSTGMLQGSIIDNLAWVKNEMPSAEQLSEALDCVQMTEVVEALPGGLDATIDRRDGSLSGGERQRLAIARELLREPWLLILDEATNALDVDTERRILRNIRDRYPKLTLLVIAHRESAIELADRVIDLDREIHARNV